MIGEQAAERKGFSVVDKPACYYHVSPESIIMEWDVFPGFTITVELSNTGEVLREPRLERRDFDDELIEEDSSEDQQ